MFSTDFKECFDMLQVMDDHIAEQTHRFLDEYVSSDVWNPVCRSIYESTKLTITSFIYEYGFNT